MKEQLALLPAYLTAHLQLALIALLVGSFTAVPLAILAARRRRLRTLILTFSSLIQTIPGLALLAIMVPFLAMLNDLAQRFLAMSVPSIGFLPALIALWLYSMLPIVQNTVTGLAGVDVALVEAALGVGMTTRQCLWRVELPQALPMIVAGLRTATVWVVGMTVLSTPVGAPSLGNYIFTGLQTRNSAAIVVGCVCAAGLALILDWLIRSIEIGLHGNQRRRFILAAGVLAALYVFVGASLAMQTNGRTKTFKIGAKAFSEQYILAEILAAQLSQATDAKVEVVQSLGSHVAYDALRHGGIDAYVEYSGTLWSTVMKRPLAGVARQTLVEQVSRFVEADKAAVAAILGFDNTYALAMRRADARALHVQTLDDLAAHAGTLRIAGDYEFFGRSEWRALQQAYGLAFAEQRSMDPALMYTAIADHAVDLVTAYTTDGRLDSFDLEMLTDTRHVMPPYDAMVLVGQSLQKDARAMQALARLSGRINRDTMRRLNLAVDSQAQTPAEAAGAFIKSLSAR